MDLSKSKQNPALIIFDFQILGGFGVSKKEENSAFICVHCGMEVLALTNGSYRNHCPHCLYSMHVDNIPGDRASSCKGCMKPTGIVYHSKKGYQISHKCEKCGFERANKVACNTVMPDDLEQVIRLCNMQPQKAVYLRPGR